MRRTNCPTCHRRIAVTSWNEFVAHNQNASGDGALFRSSVRGSCPTSGRKDAPKETNEVRP